MAGLGAAAARAGGRDRRARRDRPGKPAPSPAGTDAPCAAGTGVSPRGTEGQSP
jgi:hypothetical protein